MNFKINDRNCTLDRDKISVGDMVSHFNLKAEKGVAIAINNEVVPRSDWPSHLVHDQDKVLLITATQGG